VSKESQENLQSQGTLPCFAELLCILTALAIIRGVGETRNQALSDGGV